MTATKSALQLLCAALILIAPALHAQNDASTATAKRLMVSSGLAVQLRGVTGQIVDDIRQNMANVDQSTVERLAEAAGQAFRPEALQQDITVRVAKKLTVGDMNAALAWLDADTGARITRAEEAASGAMDTTALTQYAHRLQTTPLPAERQKMIADLISATGAVRVAASVAESMALGIALGMDALQPRERRVGEARIRAHMRQAMPADKLQALFAQQLPLSYAYTYREISDADLAAYVAFLRGATGKRYQEGMNAAFMEGIARASLRFGDFAATRERQTAL
jgi:hypothetical protein